MPSSVIRRFAYAPQTRCLTITFVTGRVYAYDDVPEAVIARFGAATSKGAFFNNWIRDRYRYRELTPDGASEQRRRA